MIVDVQQHIGPFYLTVHTGSWSGRRRWNLLINQIECDRNPNENESIDIGGPSHMTYKDLFKQTAEVLDKRLPTIDLPIIPIWLSKYWVKLILRISLFLCFSP